MGYRGHRLREQFSPGSRWTGWRCGGVDKPLTWLARLAGCDPLLGRSVCAAGQPACTQVSRCIGLSGSDREFPRFAARSGTQRARGIGMTRRCAWCGNPIPSRPALTHPRPAPSKPGCGPCAPPLLPIGLTAADLFAGGEVSRADSCVRRPGTFTCARCPAVRSALDAVPEAYHNPAVVRWGPLQLPRSSRTRWSWSLSPGADGRAVDDRLRGVPRSPGRTGGGFSLAVVRRLVGLLECSAWPDSGFLARPLGGAAVDSRFDQRVYRAM